MSFRNTPKRTARSREEPAACTMTFKFSMMHSVCCAASPVSALPVVGSNAVWPETNTNPLALMACEYGPIALGPLSVKITSLTAPPQGRTWKLENRTTNPATPVQSLAGIGRPIFHFLFSIFRFLFFRSVTIAKVLRYSRAVKPHAKRLGQILPSRLLQRRPQIIEAYLLAAQQRNHLRQAAAHRRFAIRIFQRDEK